MKFIDLINIEQLRSLFNHYTSATNIPMSILEYPSQKILIATGWQKICTDFHRVNPESAMACHDSDEYLSSCLKNKDSLSISYCQSGFIDGCVPIIIDGEHLATIFGGQVLFEKPDIEKFKLQAKKYGFDEATYLEALKKVPITTKEKFTSNLKYFAELATVFAEIGLARKNIIEKEIDISNQYKLLEQKEEELAQTQALLTTVFEKSPAAIIIFDKNLSPQYINQLVPELFGQDRESLMKFSRYNPKLNFKILYPDRKEYPLEELPPQQVIDKKIDMNSVEIIIKRDDESERWILANVAPILDNKGNVIQVICVFLDITKNKTLENELLKERLNLENKVNERTSELFLSLARLEKANKYKNQFLTSMSHELRTPLNAILGFTQLLKMEYFGNLNEKQAEYIKLINESSGYLLSLINDLLDLAKIDSGSIELSIKPFSPNNLISEITKLMSNLYKEKKITLESKVNIQTDLIEADERKCKQILFNLLSNALKFTPEGGLVELNTIQDVEQNEIKFSVTDNGIGIKDEEKEIIFDEFFQSDITTELSIKGTGIGLTLSKKLVEMQGGRIGVESEINKGSTFWFTIPIKSALK